MKFLSMLKQRITNAISYICFWPMLVLGYGIDVALKVSYSSRKGYVDFHNEMMGISLDKPLEEFTKNDCERIWSTNAKSIYYKHFPNGDFENDEKIKDFKECSPVDFYTVKYWKNRRSKL